MPDSKGPHGEQPARAEPNLDDSAGVAGAAEAGEAEASEDGEAGEAEDGEAEAAEDGEAAGEAEAGPRRFGTGWLALAVAVGLILGFAAGLLAPALRLPGDESAEAGFARDMSLHHASAVEMALMAHRRSSNPDVQDIAYDIATSQQSQIGVMGRWLKEWNLSPNPSRPRMAWMPEGTAALTDGLMPGMPTKAEMDRYATATGNEADVLFAQYMLRHHLGGIHMVDGVLAQSDRDEVVRLAANMKSVQQREVSVFRALLEDLGAEPL